MLSCRIGFRNSRRQRPKSRSRRPIFPFDLQTLLRDRLSCRRGDEPREFQTSRDFVQDHDEFRLFWLVRGFPEWRLPELFLSVFRIGTYRPPPWDCPYLGVHLLWIQRLWAVSVRSYGSASMSSLRLRSPFRSLKHCAWLRIKPVSGL